MNAAARAFNVKYLEGVVGVRERVAFGVVLREIVLHLARHEV